MDENRIIQMDTIRRIDANMLPHLRFFYILLYQVHSLLINRYCKKHTICYNKRVIEKEE